MQLWGGISWWGLLVKWLRALVCILLSSCLLLITVCHCLGCVFICCVCVPQELSMWLYSLALLDITPSPTWCAAFVEASFTRFTAQEARPQVGCTTTPIAYRTPYTVCVMAFVVSPKPPPILPGSYGYFAICASPLLLCSNVYLLHPFALHGHPA